MLDKAALCHSLMCCMLYILCASHARPCHQVEVANGQGIPSSLGHLRQASHHPVRKVIRAHPVCMNRFSQAGQLEHKAPLGTDMGIACKHASTPRPCSRPPAACLCRRYRRGNRPSYLHVPPHHFHCRSPCREDGQQQYLLMIGNI